MQENHHMKNSTIKSNRHWQKSNDAKLVKIQEESVGEFGKFPC